MEESSGAPVNSTVRPLKKDAPTVLGREEEDSKVLGMVSRGALRSAVEDDAAIAPEIGAPQKRTQ